MRTTLRRSAVGVALAGVLFATTACGMGGDDEEKDNGGDNAPAEGEDDSKKGSDEPTPDEGAESPAPTDVPTDGEQGGGEGTDAPTDGEGGSEGGDTIDLSDMGTEVTSLPLPEGATATEKGATSEIKTYTLDVPTADAVSFYETALKDEGFEVQALGDALTATGKGVSVVIAPDSSGDASLVVSKGDLNSIPTG